ncbi:cytochrome c peroxidase [Accumulibacter sp.]|uniref:cytochrome c peroxidase n=1 Tax=Accumulibacter sp. TaxID=2053492 RepID=UPI0025EAF19D|nr:cytochrome c peroxidase [Accumulibacter sp.]MCM8597029.1 hypothetical protein [Accumulibacter sp.]MDS4051178.1 cytochrome c peroxidase [Accumulibacter sp.]
MLPRVATVICCWPLRRAWRSAFPSSPRTRRREQNRQRRNTSARRSLFDANLSVNANQSCATCRVPEAGWTGPESAIDEHRAVYEGSIPDAFGDRKLPSAAYATQSPILFMNRKGLFTGGNFSDGRATGQRPLFTDYPFDTLGIPQNPENAVHVSNPSFVDPGLGGFLASRPEYAAYADANRGKHKVPTVRNVANGLSDGITKAYGHNG